jgi:hypothetical protein
MVVSCAKGRDVASAQFTNVGERTTAPTETLAAKTFDQKVSCQASVTTISVWKGVDRNQAMVKPDGNFIRRKCLMHNPISDVA